MHKKVKPYMQVRVQRDGYSYVGEAMSFETPEHTAMVRRVPGHPGTLDEVPVAILEEPSAKMKYVHYAIIKGFGSFPIDMLRYDCAAPVNFTLEQGDYGNIVKVDPSFGFGDDLVIANATPNSRERWTQARWRSFGWSVRPLKSEKLDAIEQQPKVTGRITT